MVIDGYDVDIISTVVVTDFYYVDGVKEVRLGMLANLVVDCISIGLRVDYEASTDKVV